MNVKEAVRRLNGYLQRRGKVDGSGGWTEQYLLDLLTDAKLSGLPMAIWYMGTLSKDEDISASNIPVPIQMVRRTNLDSTSSNSAVNSTTGFSTPYANITLPGAFPLGGANGYSTYEGYYLGKKLTIRPVPNEDLYMYVRWTPDELPALVDEDQDLLGGFLPQFHPAVV